MRIVFASAEVSPIAKSGGLGDVAGSLPKALAALGHDITVFMPFYREARRFFERRGQAPEPIESNVAMSWGNWTLGLTLFRTTLPGTSIPLILIANDHFFDREQIYSARHDGYDDNLERFTFFCRGVIRACELLDIRPDIVHAHDWHTALLPVYLHSGLRGSDQFAQARSVYTIHNLNYQGVAPADRLPVLGLHSRYWQSDALEHYGDINLMKGGILFADQVTTVSPTYAREIQTSEHGAGLDGLLRHVSPKLSGILNGIDAVEWNPATDPLLPAHFNAAELRGKSAIKEALARELGLAATSATPFLGIVSRLVDQKGFQLLLPVLPKLIEAGARVIVLGSGESHFEAAFAEIGRRYRDRCHVHIGFDNPLAHRIYAGCDLLLMPSLYEPCGLNQMYALRYGTLPVVRLTGGLADTVVPFDGTNAASANGFGFTSTNPDDLYLTTWIGMLAHGDRAIWNQLQQNGMNADFSWHRSAREYENAYRRAGA
jgi:starch synthase